MSAEPVPHLRVIHCAECERLTKGIALIQVDLDNANNELAVKRRRITALENEAAGRRRVDPLYETALELWRFWKRDLHPKARKMSDRQLKALLARLKDRTDEDEQAYDPRYIAECIRGARFEAYTSPNGKRHDGIELICEQLEDFHGRYERGKQ